MNFKNVDWTFADEEPRPGRNKMHLYPAAMHASYVSKFLEHFKPSVVFDPFGGSGTVALECVKRNIEVFTNDLNPLACLITKSKVAIYSKDFEDQVNDILLAVEKIRGSYTGLITLIHKEAFPKTVEGQEQRQNDDIFFERLKNYNVTIPKFKNIAYWFLPEVALSLSVIKLILPSDPFFQVCFSECVRMVSNRRSGEFKLYRKPIEELIDYNPDVFSTFSKIVKRNLDIIIANPVHNDCCKVSGDDACGLNSIPNNCVDLLLTSPPYGDSGTTVAYGQFSRLSLQWLDIEANQIDNLLLGGKNSKDCDLGKTQMAAVVDKLRKKDEKRAREVMSFFCDLGRAFSSMDKKVKVGGHQVWITGNRMVKETRLPLDLYVKEIGERLGYSCVDIVYRNIPYKAMPKQNCPSNEKGKKVDTMTQESIVILRKDKQTDFSVYIPGFGYH